MRAVHVPMLVVICAAALAVGCTKQSSSTDTTSTEVTSAPTTAADAAASVSATPVAEISPGTGASTVPSAAATAAASSAATTTSSAAGAAAPTPLLVTVNFTDVNGNYAQKAIVALGQIGALDSTNGAFQPQNAILRRDFARWLFKTNNAVWADVPGKQIHPAEAGDKSDFTDLQPSDPDFKFIEGLSEAGISVGFPDKTFRPEQPLTHEQAIAIKAVLDRGGVADRVKSPDSAIISVPDWKDKRSISKTFLPAIATDHSDDEIDSTKIDNVGRAFGAVAMFKPQTPVTRAQAAMLLQVVGGHAQDTNTGNEPRSVDGVLHPKPRPTP